MARATYGAEISAEGIKNVSKHFINAARKALSDQQGFFYSSANRAALYFFLSSQIKISYRFIRFFSIKTQGKNHV